MTLSSLSRKISYDGDNTANALAVPFTFEDASDLLVTELDLTTHFETVKVDGVDYTVTGGAGSTGTVTPAATRSTNVRWVIERETPPTQDTDLTAGTRLPVQSIEDALDRLARITQDVKDIADRGIKIGSTDSPWVGEVPAAANRASMYLGFDASGEPQALSAPTGTSITTAYILTLLDDANDTAARATLVAMKNVFTTRGDMVRAGVGGVAERVAIPASAYIWRSNGVDGDWAQPVRSDYKAFYPATNSLSGMGLGNGVAIGHQAVNFAAGVCRNAADTYGLQSTSQLVKLLDLSWAVGSAQGGLAASLTIANNTWYHCFAIGSENGSCEFGFDTSLTAANLLATAGVVSAGYTTYRRLGSVLTDGAAAIQTFTQIGSHFMWTTPVLDVSAATIGNAAALQTLSVPLGVKVDALFNVSATGGNAVHYLLINSPDQDAIAPSATANQLSSMTLLPDGGGTSRASSSMRVRTDTSKRVRGWADANLTTYISTLGWIDPRGII